MLLLRIPIIGLLMLLLSLMLLSFALGGYIVFSTKAGSSASSTLVDTVPFYIFGLPVALSLNTTISSLFLFLMLLYLIFFAFLTRGPVMNLTSALRRMLKAGPESLFSNGALVTISSFSMIHVLTVAIEFLQERVGLPTGSLPEREPLLMFLSVTLAPLTEEIGFRVSIIGVAALLMAPSGAMGASPLMALWHPSRYLEGHGSEGRAIKKLSPIILASSIFFGLAHFLYGSGWMVGKVVTSSLAGLVLGWLYVQYGFPSALLLHWSFNFFPSAYSYAQIATGIPALSSFVAASVTATGLSSLGIMIFLGVKGRVKGLIITPLRLTS